MAAFDAICSAQKDRRLGASHLQLYLTLPYLTLPSEGADVAAIWCKTGPKKISGGSS